MKRTISETNYFQIPLNHNYKTFELLYFSKSTQAEALIVGDQQRVAILQVPKYLHTRLCIVRKRIQIMFKQFLPNQYNSNNISLSKLSPPMSSLLFISGQTLPTQPGDILMTWFKLGILFFQICVNLCCDGLYTSKDSLY